MTWSNLLVPAPYVVSLLICTAAAWGIWHQRQSGRKISIALFATSGAVVSLGYLGEILAAEPGPKLIWENIQVTFTIVAALSFLHFVQNSSDFGPGVSRWKWHVLRGLSLTSLLPVLLNPFLNLLQPVQTQIAGTSFTSVAYEFTGLVQAIYLSILGIYVFGMIQLFRSLEQTPFIDRAQALAVFSGFLIQAVASSLAAFGTGIINATAAAPFAFALTSAIVSSGIYRHRAADTAPKARTLLVESMGDPVIVLDLENRIIDINSAAKSAIALPASKVIGRPAAKVFSKWPHLVKRFEHVDEARAVIDLSDEHTELTYELKLSPIHDQYNQKIGRLLIVHDITERLQQERELAHYRDFLEELVTERAADLQSLNDRLQQEIQEHQRTESKVRHYADRLEIVHQIDQAIILAKSPIDIINAALSHIRQLVPCQRISLTLFNTRSEEAVVFAAAINGGPPAASGQRFPLHEFGIDEPFEQGHARIIDDISTSEERTQLQEIRLTAEGIRSYINVPMMTRGKLVGSLNLASTQPANFGTADVEIAGLVADQLAIALEQSRLSEETQHRLKELTALHAIAIAAAESVCEDELLARCTEIIGQTLYLTHFGALLIDQANDMLIPHISYRGISQAAMDLRIPLGQGIAGSVAKSGEVRRLPDVTKDPDYIEASPETRSELCVPLKVRDRIIGVINTESHESDAYSEADERLLVTCAGQLASAIERLRTQTAERTRAKETSALLATGKLVSASLDMNQVLEAISHQVRQLLQADGSRIHLLESDGETLTCVPSPEEAANSYSPTRFALGQDEVGAVAASGKAMIMNAGEQNGTKSTTPRANQEMRHLALAPLRMRDRVIGVMTASRLRQNAGFTSAELKLLSSFASQATMAIGNARLYSDLEKALRKEQETRAHLIQSEKLSALGQLAASVAHELNNPLQIIRDALRAIENTNDLASSSATELNLAQREIQRMVDLVRHLRETYQPALHADLQPTSLNEIILEVQQLTKTHMSHRRVKLTTDLAPELPIVPAIADHMRQIILNLSLNAVEAMPDGGRLLISTGCAESGDEVWLKVSDAGIGISAEDLDHIFEPFFTRKRGGSGLGLAIVRDLVEQQKGRIVAESEPGQGSTFTLYLPSEAARFNRILP